MPNCAMQWNTAAIRKNVKCMKKIGKPVKQIVIGTYQSMRAAAQQVDLLMKGNGDLCVNIVQEGRKFQVRTVVWQ